MLRSLKILTICLIMMSGSGCSLFKERIIQPLCLPDRPTLINLSNEEKYDLYLANATALEALSINDTTLKNHIETIEEVVREHNKQFKAQCP